MVRTPGFRVSRAPVDSLGASPESSVGAHAASARATTAARVVQRARRTAYSGWLSGDVAPRIRGNPGGSVRVPRVHEGDGETMGHKHFNGLKTAALFGAMW